MTKTERSRDTEAERIEAADGVGNGDSPEALLMRRMVDAYAEFERRLVAELNVEDRDDGEA